MRAHVAISLTLALLLTVPLHGQDEPPRVPSTFEGLRGVMIDVEPPAPDLEEKGITAFVISTAVEKRLKESGVPVFPSDNPRLAPGFPALYVQVVTMYDEVSKQCTWSIRVELNQFVRMERDPETVAVAASTWGVGGIGSEAKNWRQALLDDVLNYVDQFVEAFAEANPEGIEP